jgi:hypothetical protein
MYLQGNDIKKNFKDEIYLAGVNGSNKKEGRKIVWVGKVTSMMTFAKAFNTFHQTPKYSALLKEEESPILVEPVTNGIAELLGYQKYGDLHKFIDKKSNIIYWHGDLTSKPSKESSQTANMDYISKTDFVFDRDLCFILKNIHAAGKRYLGIPFNKTMVNILRKNQADRKHIDDYAIFGRQRGLQEGNADGRTGSWLELQNRDAEIFISEILESKKLTKRKTDLPTDTSKTLLKQPHLGKKSVC